MEKIKILTLGPEGTFSHKAVLNYLSKNLKNKIEGPIEIDFCKNISEVFDYVEKGKDFQEKLIGVVPVENMLDGSVGETLDLLFRKNVFVIDEIIIPISHCLASLNSVDNLDQINKVISHPKALGQCTKIIRGNGFETVQEVSTAGAMKKVSELSNSDGSDIAAIGPEIAAKKYGLKILKKRIEDNKNNVTRFFIISSDEENFQIGNKEQYKKKNCKTSLAIHPHQDRPGLLLDLLKSFSLRNINLTKIESRPTKANLGEYIFYIDFKGSQFEEKPREALQEIEKMGEVRIFGSYAKGG